jgi:pimeloyl-ACP methyl ester carboxylesterase
MRSIRMSNFILIHSTGEAPSCWRRLATALELHEHRTHPVDLPVDRPDLLAADYANIMREQVGHIAEPIVLAHSGSGTLLPAASKALKARHRVWLAAWVPNSHASFMEEVRANPTEIFNPDWIGKDPTNDSSVAINFLYHDCDQATIDWALRTRRLFVPLAVYNQRIVLDDDIPSSYIVASKDRTIRPDWQRRMARERLHIEPLEIATGHLPHVSAPERLAELLAHIAATMKA